MVGFKLQRGATGRESSWSPDDVDDPVNQMHILHDLLDDQWGTPPYRSVAASAPRILAAATGLAGLIGEVRSVPKVTLAGTFFRARAWPEELAPEDFGQAPHRPRNRFNANGESALYLARSERWLREEVSQGGEAVNVWAQRFEVPPGPGVLTALDPIAARAFPRLNQLMILSERPRSREPLDPYLATQLLRIVCVQQGIDGVEYPTVTGAFASDPCAVNVALFSEATIARVLESRSGEPYRICTDNPQRRAPVP